MAIKPMNSIFFSPPWFSLLPFLDQECHQALQERTGTKKEQFTTAGEEGHPVSSYSDKYAEMLRGWDPFIFCS